MNDTRLGILKNSVTATLGLMLFGVAVYLVIQANIGVNPWDAFCLGLADKLGVLYGTASIMISFAVICIDLLLREKIGLGTILDAVVVVKTVDLLNWLDLIPKQNSMWISLPMMFLGFFIAGFSQYIYMKAGLSCGPRDAMQVAIGRRMPRVPIGAVNVIILAVVLLIGWGLGGPIGIGTLIAPFASGGFQQLAFNIMKFEPKEVKHQDLTESFNVLSGRKLTRKRDFYDGQQKE